MNLDVALEAQAGSRDRVIDLLRTGTQRRTTRWLSWRPLTVAAAACVTMMCGWWLTRPVQTVEVLAVSGMVKWQADDGTSSGVAEAQRLSSGHFETANEDALLRLRFADGTVVEFSGPSKAEVSAGTQKIVRMTKGLLAAQVAPQPAGQPMRVFTPTAAIEVLGTIFTLDAAADEGRLSVEEGRVSLRRLVDDKSTQVSADHGVVASLDASDPLSPMRIERLPVRWSASFDPMRERVIGKVSAAHHVGAVAKMLSDPMSDEAPAVHWRVQVAPARKESVALASLTAGAVLEVRWRSTREVVPRIVLRTFRARSGCRGGFTAPLEPEAGRFRVFPSVVSGR